MRIFQTYLFTGRYAQDNLGVKKVSAPSKNHAKCPIICFYPAKKKISRTFKINGTLMRVIMLQSLYHRKLILAIVVFPSQNNNIVQCVFGVLWPWGNWKFLAVRRVGLMTHGECRVDCLLPNHAIR